MHSEVEGLFLVRAAPPFEKAVGRKQASTAQEGISEGRLVGNRLRPRIVGQGQGSALGRVDYL